MKVEHHDYGTLELRATADVDGGGRLGEHFPDDRFTNFGGGEQVNTGTEAVISLLKEFIKKNDDEQGNDKLHGKEEADTSAKIFWLAIKTGRDIHSSLTKSDNKSKDCAMK